MGIPIATPTPTPEQSESDSGSRAAATATAAVTGAVVWTCAVVGRYLVCKAGDAVIRMTVEGWLSGDGQWERLVRSALPPAWRPDEQD